MDQSNHPMGGAANTPPFESGRSALETAADHQIPEETSPAHEASAAQPGATGEAEPATDRTAQTMHNAQRMVRDRAGELADRAETRVNAGMKQAADRLDRAAEQIDHVATQRLAGSGVRGQAGQMARSLADGLEATASYLRTNDVQSLRSDLERQMHERPLQTLLIGVAAGWVVGKILR